MCEPKLFQGDVILQKVCLFVKAAMDGPKGCISYKRSHILIKQCPIIKQWLPHHKASSTSPHHQSWSHEENIMEPRYDIIMQSSVPSPQEEPLVNIIPKKQHNVHQIGALLAWARLVSSWYIDSLINTLALEGNIQEFGESEKCQQLCWRHSKVNIPQ